MLPALVGGVLIGLAAALLLASQGRIAGISGIVEGALAGSGWRLAFLAGLLVAGAIGAVVSPSAIGAAPHRLPVVALAGALVGIGTRTSGGCTSGHGVCGVARLSRRSIVAVATFMVTGAVTVWAT